MYSFNCLINLDVGIYIQIKAQFTVVGLSYGYRLLVEHVFILTFGFLNRNANKCLSAECRLSAWQYRFELILILSVNTRESWAVLPNLWSFPWEEWQGIYVLLFLPCKSKQKITGLIFLPYLKNSFVCLKYITKLPAKIRVRRAKGRKKADESGLHAPLTYSLCIRREN